MGLEKPSRHYNSANRETVRSKPCVVTGAYGVDVHHIITQGAGGGDYMWNLLPLRREKHIEWHKNPRTFILKYEQVRQALRDRGWIVNDGTGEIWHPKRHESKD